MERDPALVGKEDDVPLELVDLAEQREEQLIRPAHLRRFAVGRFGDAAVEQAVEPRAEVLRLPRLVHEVLRVHQEVLVVLATQGSIGELADGLDERSRLGFFDCANFVRPSVVTEDHLKLIRREAMNCS